jgi:CheY-like chemotaxis protein/pimeloyl-ACP methyl ester carboxylesterase
MPGTPPVVAVLDDEPQMRTALRRLLASHGFRVEAYARGEDLLAALAAHPLDCLVLDLHMPEVSGFEVPAAFASQHILTPVVVITGHDEPGTVERVRALGGSAYLTKPVDEAALLSAIAAASALPDLSRSLTSRVPESGTPATHAPMMKPFEAITPWKLLLMAALTTCTAADPGWPRVFQKDGRRRTASPAWNPWHRAARRKPEVRRPSRLSAGRLKPSEAVRVEVTRLQFPRDDQIRSETRDLDGCFLSGAPGLALAVLLLAGCASPIGADRVTTPWLFLFGEGKDPPPDAFERRFREACDLYNYSLGLALTGPRSTNAAVRLESGRRRLPVGEIEVSLSQTHTAVRLEDHEQLLLADKFRVRGLSVRNREAGVGAPLICVGPLNPEFGVRRCAPATVFLRVPRSLAEVAAGHSSGSLEVYSALDEPVVDIGGTRVPLETDLTTYRAYTLNQAFIWKLGMLQFFAPAERVRSQLIMNQPSTPGRIPVVFVHGTFSSPVTWAEMANSLTADPVLRSRYQLWSFVYSSGNPLPVSAGELRDALTATVNKLDPEGKDPALQQLVIIGHSQGSLLTKLAAVETGDRIGSVFSTNRIEDLKIGEADREKLRHLLFLRPLPFVTRVVFICGPHRGSYLAGGLARSLARRLMSLPGSMVARSKEVSRVSGGSAAGKFLGGKMPTSLDSMSPKNPGLLALAEIPVSPPIKSHSIIAIDGDDQPPKGGDGVVKYTSAHQDYTESEFIVRSYHSCLNQSAAIEEVRRILPEHLDQLPPGTLRTESRGSPLSSARNATNGEETRVR